MTKICFKCKDEKSNSDFSDAQFLKKSGWCRVCISLSKKSYYQDNKEVIHDRVKKYQQGEKSFEYRKEYYIKNKDEKSAYSKIYYEDNKEQLIIASKKYYKENKDEIMLYRKEYQKSRRKNDPTFKLRALVSNSIGFALKKNKSSKNNNSCIKYLDYSFQELMTHLESQFDPWMNWNNHGKYDPKSWDDSDQSTWTWQIDHVIPHSNFHYTSMEDQVFKKCWALSNLRPYSSKQNLLDGNRR